MKLSKLLLSAILIGITVQTTTSCTNDDAKPNSEQGEKNANGEEVPVGCPACGMG